MRPQVPLLESRALKPTEPIGPDLRPSKILLSVPEHFHLVDVHDRTGHDDEEVASGLHAGVAVVERVARWGSARVVEAGGGAAGWGRHGHLRSGVGQSHREVDRSGS